MLLFTGSPTAPTSRRRRGGFASAAATGCASTSKRACANCTATASANDDAVTPARLDTSRDGGRDAHVDAAIPVVVASASTRQRRPGAEQDAVSEWPSSLSVSASTAARAELCAAACPVTTGACVGPLTMA